MVKKFNVITILIAIAGFCASLYALILHVKHLMSPGGGSFCDLNATINCSAVIGSKYGEFAAIPLGAYGIAYFGIIFAAALTPKFTYITHKQLAKLELCIALVGLLVVAGLIFISYGVLKIVCPTCSIIHVLVIIYTILKFFQFLKVKNEKITPQETYHAEPYLVFFALALCLAIPPLIAGLLSPILVNYFGKAQIQMASFIEEDTKAQHQNLQQIPKAVTPSMEKEGTESTLRHDLLSFNKSNFVGNGEDYRRGSDNAPIVVQMFSDFGCPHCKTANDALLKAQDIIGQDKVVIVYRFYPLSSECNQYVGAKGWYGYNCALVVAVRCAGQQNKFWEFKEWAFSGQDWTNQERDQHFSLSGLQAQAKKLHMNTETFTECFESHNEDAKIKDDIILANQLNIQGTPMILINGTIYKGPFDAQLFVQKFEDALQRSAE